MTIEEKVGQMLMPFFTGETVNEQAKLLIERAHVGNIILYSWANGLHNPEQVQKLTNALQLLAQSNFPHIPLLITVDQEGGLVVRLRNGFTHFPGNGALGKANDERLAYACALATGKELRAVGINMNLAPVVDVNSKPSYPIISIRSFGSSAQQASKLGSAMCKGYEQAGVIATLKHFPGYGEVSVDPHLDLPVIRKTLDELNMSELIPFKAIQADAIMTAHLMVPALDPEHCITLSSIVLEQMVRKEWGYEGVLISDSLTMQGVLNACGDIAEASIRAIEAGHDILIFGGKHLNQKDNKELTAEDIVAIHSTIVKAVKEGRIAEKRLDQSITRILNIKQKYGILEAKSPVQKDIIENVGTNENLQLAQEIARKSVEIQKLNFPANLKRALVVSSKILDQDEFRNIVGKAGLSAEYLFYDKDSAEEIVRKMNDFEKVIFLSRNAWNSKLQQELLSSCPSNKLILMATLDPKDAELVPTANGIIYTYSPAMASIETAFRLLRQ